MPLFENHVGVSVGLNKIKVAELVYRNNEFLLENVEEEDFDESLEVNFSHEDFFNVLQKSFRKLVSRKSIKSNNISFSLEPAFFEVFEVPYDNTLLKKDLIEHFRWELKKLKPKLAAENFLIQNVELKKLDEKNNSATTVLAIDKSIVNSISKFCQQNQLTLRYVDYSHTSSDNLLHFKKALAGLTGLSIYKTNKYYSFIVSDNFSPLTIIKRERVGVELPLSDIKLKLKKVLSANDTQKGLQYSFIAGQNITQLEIERFNKELNLKTQLLNPFSLIKTTDNFSSTLDLNEFPSEYSSAIGVALRLI